MARTEVNPFKKCGADYHTGFGVTHFLGLIAGLRASGGDDDPLDLLVEQLRIRQDELQTDL